MTTMGLPTQNKCNKKQAPNNRIVLQAGRAERTREDCVIAAPSAQCCFLAQCRDLVLMSF